MVCVNHPVIHLGLVEDPLLTRFAQSPDQKLTISCDLADIHQHNAQKKEITPAGERDGKK